MNYELDYGLYVCITVFLLHLKPWLDIIFQKSFQYLIIALNV